MMGEKKVKGRKRHILVDTQGFLVQAAVTGADFGDREGLLKLIFRAGKLLESTKLIWADMGYQGEKTKKWVSQFGIQLEIVRRPLKGMWVHKDTDISSLKFEEGFKVLPKRWIVERTFAWMSKYRRLSKDYEYFSSTTESMMYISMSRLMLRRN
jgi:putative transposase